MCACQTVPYTGRSHLILVSQDEEKQLGLRAYQETLKKSKLSNDHEKVEMLRRVGHRLARAANKPDFQWEFNLIVEDKTINAWCLPGGKMAVYTGLLPVSQDEDGLAVVLGHEIAHALARHGSERMSQAMVAQGLGQVGSLLLTGNSAVSQQLFANAYGIGAQLGMLHYGRKEESEADHIGLILMAQAGYDPHKAVDFWGRMMKAMGGAKGDSPLAKYLSDHPPDKERQQAIQGWMPEALKYYNVDQPK
jgi:predicted Zn-dependent protease